MSKGPARSRPMWLQVHVEDETIDQPDVDGGTETERPTNKGKQHQRPLSRGEFADQSSMRVVIPFPFFLPLCLSDPSFYPGDHGCASMFDEETELSPNSSLSDSLGDPHGDTEEDLSDDEDLADFTQGKGKGKVYKTIVHEVCVMCSNLLIPLTLPYHFSQRPSWKGSESASVSMPSTSVSRLCMTSLPCDDVSLQGDSSAPRFPSMSVPAASADTPGK